MIRYARTFALAALLSTGACEKPGVTEQQREDKAAQNNAEQQDRAARESASAQAEMNRQVASARADFERAREDYRHQKQTDLEALDARIGKIEAKDAMATAKAKADLDAKLLAIRSQRASFGADFRALMQTTAASWDDTRTRLDREWDSLKAAVDDAS
jgi:hypothetical protein